MKAQLLLTIEFENYSIKIKDLIGLVGEENVVSHCRKIAGCLHLFHHFLFLTLCLFSMAFFYFNELSMIIVTCNVTIFLSFCFLKRKEMTPQAVGQLVRDMGVVKRVAIQVKLGLLKIR